MIPTLFLFYRNDMLVSSRLIVSREEFVDEELPMKIDQPLEVLFFHDPSV